MPFAKEKEEEESLCPEVVLREPVFKTKKKKKHTASTNQRYFLTTNTLTACTLNSSMGREVL